MNKDHFAAKAGSYDHNQDRQDNVGNIATAIRDGVGLSSVMHVMDFGAGTGLLLQRIAPYVGKVTAVDVSPAMIAQLEAKREQIEAELMIVEADLSKEPMEESFDGIISSMTLHHVEDVPAMLRRLGDMVKPGGFIAIADLETEDGSFHDEDTGVFHFGFDPDALAVMAEESGLTSVSASRVSVVKKPHGDFPVFLLMATV